MYSSSEIREQPGRGDEVENGNETGEARYSNTTRTETAQRKMIFDALPC